MNQVFKLEVPKAGRYFIGTDEGSSDENVAAVILQGENGNPDELVQTLKRDKYSGVWEPSR